MAIQRKNCANHPDRRAIGVCVITGKAICAECSTRYEGVNYSKEGLRLLREQRAGRTKKTDVGERSLGWLILFLTPGLLFLLYLAYLFSFRALTGLAELEL